MGVRLKNWTTGDVERLQTLSLRTRELGKAFKHNLH
jgi:hypothetical protein